MSKTTTSAFRLQVSDPSVLADLAEALSTHGYVATPVNSTELAVITPSAPTAKDAAGALLLLVHRWRRRGVTVAMISTGAAAAAPREAN
jgi:hypothetical protein